MAVKPGSPKLYALAGLKAQSAILDGEIVCLDSNGVSQFKELLYRRGRAVLFAFDLVWLNGVDLRRTPLIDRKKKLRRLIEASECSEIILSGREILPSIRTHPEGLKSAALIVRLAGISAMPARM